MEEECVQCTHAAKGEYMGYPCCMKYECMNEIKMLEEMSEKVAREQFGEWLKRMLGRVRRGIRKK